MSELLDKTAVAHRLNVSEKTAAALMMEMSPIAITGSVRKQYRVTEASFEQWVANHMLFKPSRNNVCKGTRRKLERR